MAITAQMVKEIRERTGAGMLDCKKALEENNGDIEATIVWLKEKGIIKAAKKADRIAAEGLTAFKIDGNSAIVCEINSETDFVAKNQQFIDLINNIASTLLNAKVSDNETALKTSFGEGTIESAIIDATSVIGEKISFRRVSLLEKNDNQSFGAYSHMNGNISVIVVLDGANKEDVAKDVAMQIAALDPKFISRADVDENFIASERAILEKTVIEEGANPQFAGKMVEGRLNKMLKEICLVDQPFVKNGDITVGEYLKQNGTSIISYERFKVGEGIEKKVDNFAEEVMNQIKPQ